MLSPFPEVLVAWPSTTSSAAGSSHAGGPELFRTCVGRDWRRDSLRRRHGRGAAREARRGSYVWNSALSKREWRSLLAQLSALNHLSSRPRIISPLNLCAAAAYHCISSLKLALPLSPRAACPAQSRLRCCSGPTRAGRGCPPPHTWPGHQPGRGGRGGRGATVLPGRRGDRGDRGDMLDDSGHPLSAGRARRCPKRAERKRQAPRGSPSRSRAPTRASE